MVSLAKAFLQKAATVFGGNISTVAATFAIASIIVSVEGLESFGLYSVLMSLYMVAGAIKPLTWQAFVKYYPSFNVQLLLAKSVVIDLFGILTSLLLLFIIILAKPIWQTAIDIDIWVLAVIFVTATINNNGTLLGYLRSERQYFTVALLQMVVSIFKVALCFFIFFEEARVYSIELFIMLSCMVDAIIWGGGIISIVVYKRAYKMWGASLLSKVKGYTKFSYQGTATAMVDLPVSHLDSLIVTALLGLEAAGVFALVKRISKAFGQIADPIYQIIFPEFSKSVADKNLTSILAISRRVSLFVFSICSVGMVAFIAGFPIFDSLLFASKISEYKWLVISYMLCQVLAITFIWVHPLVIAFGELAFNFRVTLLANIVYVVALVLLLKFVGFWGVVFAIFLQYLLSIGVKLKMVLPKIRYEESLSRLSNG